MLNPVDEIKSKLDIVDIIQEYIPLKQAGANMKAVCPFHDEKTPSFMVSREKQIWHCFGCNQGGDMFEFVKKIENVEFPEALKILANKAGVRLKYQDPKITNLKTRLMAIQEQAKQWFCDQLFSSMAGKQALDYLISDRGLIQATVKEWGIGYALDSWDSLSGFLKTKGFNNQEILQSGLVVPKQNSNDYYDRFRARIMFTIEDHRGNVVGFTGRATKSDDAAKYVNSPQTLIYNKSEVIFGLNKAKQFIKQLDAVVLVEGQMDVISSHQAGVKNVVAVSGTALTSEQVKILQRFSNNIIFAFDADEAGVSAARRSVEIAWGNEANVNIVAIDKNIAKDPDDLIKKDKDLWKNMIGNSMAAMDYFIDFYFRDYNPEDVHVKKKVASEVLNLIVKIKNPIERDFYLKKLSDRLNVDDKILKELVGKKIKGNVRQPIKMGGDEAVSNKEANSQEHKNIQAAERLLALMMVDYDFYTHITENLPWQCFYGQIQDLYKLMVVYYTKHQLKEDWSADIESKNLSAFVKEQRPDLVEVLNPIQILAAEVAGYDSERVLLEMRQLIKYLKKNYLRKKLSEVTKALKQAEAGFSNSQNRAEDTKQRLGVLMEESSKISSELRELDNS